MADGVNVGLGEGMDDGVDVGIGVGMSVGVNVGIGVGMSVGVDVGLGEGIADGVDVGLGVGIADGVDVGLLVGPGVGPSVGAALDAALGALVGAVHQREIQIVKNTELCGQQFVTQQTLKTNVRPANGSRTLSITSMNPLHATMSGVTTELLSNRIGFKLTSTCLPVNNVSVGPAVNSAVSVAPGKI